MSLNVSGYIDSRIEEIAQCLRQTNSEYALSVSKIKRLYESIHPIIMSTNEESRISHGDCLDFKEYLEEEFTSVAIMQQALYRQGYLDCVKLLKILGVLV